jgi:hypothetical protein
VRGQLHLVPFKSNGRFLVAVNNRDRMEQLYARYGLADATTDRSYNQ